MSIGGLDAGVGYFVHLPGNETYTDYCRDLRLFSVDYMCTGSLH